jgi:transposase-like protein/5-methylcytosine-specific restriction endonuclease McrA
MFVSDRHVRIRSLLDAGVSIAEVARRTGVPYTAVRLQRDRLHRDGVDTQDGEHDEAPDVAGAHTSTGDEVRRLLDSGCSRAEIARRLDISRSTVSYHARRLGMPIDERPGRRYDWGAIQAYYDAGHTVDDCQERFGFCRASWSSAVRRGDAVARPSAMPIEELLRHSRNRTNLKGRLVQAGLLATVCSECGIADWRARPLALELHHINGDGKDNRLENLTLLCPNCHSQTDSWGGRNSQRAGALRS